uniref:Serine-threonine kinase receptor-associated protein n=1 Tax=Oryza glumipatula TaxID=40148 RepID=A0A0E0BL21_9ORYZ
MVPRNEADPDEGSRATGTSSSRAPRITPPTSEFTDDGERLGTYRGHTGSAEQTAMLEGSLPHPASMPPRAQASSPSSPPTASWRRERAHRSAQVKRIAEDLDDRPCRGPLNRIIITETGQCLNESDKEQGHQKTITSLSKSADWSPFLSGSLDKSAKVVIGGGQDAMNVTTRNRRAGKFEAKFFHKILQEEIGVKGHFGPINALAFNPDGRRFMVCII